MKRNKQKIIITLPVYNEEKTLSDRVLELKRYAQKNLGNFDYTILIADNGSSDNTPNIAEKLSKGNKDIVHFYTKVKGRGKVLYRVWKKYNADCYVYMDIDLATELKHLPELVSGITKKGFDIAVGTRNLKDSHVQRSLKRTIISKAYITLLKIVFGLKVSDTQCGFKAISSRAVKKLWPKMNPSDWKGAAWFFDSELLILAEKIGLGIYEVPVCWKEGPYSNVSVFKDALEDLRGIIRIIKIKPWKES